MCQWVRPRSSPGLLFLREIRDAAGPRPDALGSGLLAGCVGALALAIVQGPTWGWQSIRVLALLGAAAVLGLVLARRSQRHPAPVIEGALLRVRPFALACLAALVFFLGFGAFLLCTVIFLTGVWHESALTAGLMLAAAPGAATLVSVRSASIVRRLGPARAGALGALLAAAGTAWYLARVGTVPNFATDLLPGQLVGGAGVGLVIPSLTGAATMGPATDSLRHRHGHRLDDPPDRDGAGRSGSGRDLRDDRRRRGPGCRPPRMDAGPGCHGSQLAGDARDRAARARGRSRAGGRGGDDVTRVVPSAAEGPAASGPEGRRGMWQAAPVTASAEIPASEPHVPFVASTSYPVRIGNAVRPLVDGEPAFRRICDAIDAARRSVWVTVTFLTPDVQMPDGRGSFFDVLDRAAARGLDVRALFWRTNPETSGHAPGVFWGSPAHRDLLEARGSQFLARWDRAHSRFCQHQKSWLVDAGEDTETAFVGGINLRPHSVASPGHARPGSHHDAYVEVSGPAATDVHHNFVQRWNEASERAAEDGSWGGGRDHDLAFPTRLSGPRGDSAVQVQRTLHAGCYRDGRPTPGGQAFDVAGGERSIFDQYLRAIGAARRSIYIENQYLELPEVVAALHQALDRGVEVVVLLPAEPDEAVRAATRRSERQAFVEQRAALGRHERFALVGIAGRGAGGGRHDVYVHAKVMLIDDAWATIGSCNLHASSVYGNSEMNVSFWDPEVVRTLRCELLAEHLGTDTAQLDDRSALGEYRRLAQENRRRRDAGDSGWPGLAFAIDPATYGRQPPAV
ncbi:MAG TPA: phospholipase D-like domain-containing protein [Candidatus Dormibacteraeota bacterium]|nr:phospholipase D-like domain-containing protein [Candidatus Dormibacteraeota bacterium]